MDLKKMMQRLRQCAEEKRRKRRRRRTMIYRCRLTWTKQRLLLALFVAGSTARAAARAAGVNRDTATRIFRLLREFIALERAAIAPFFGRAEIDECYLSGGVGGRKVAKRGVSLDGKFCVVGAAQREANSGLRRLRLKIITRVNTETLTAFARETIAPGADVHTDQLSAYKLDAAGFRHFQVNHHREFRNRDTGACTNLIESAWSVLKRHFARFCGGWRHNLHLFLREVEMRWELGADHFGAGLRALLDENLRACRALNL